MEYRVKRPRIGVFDSGVGGLTVVRAVRAALPAADLLYLGDTARVPYGSKSPRTVERYAVACARFLLSRRIDLLLIACNTASATALPSVQQSSPVPVIGAVIPGAEAALAASAGKQIGVIGTLATIRSRAYELEVSARDSAASVFALACPLLVPLAEEGWTDGEVAEAVCRRYLEELVRGAPRLDTLVLGCTHYPLLRNTITRVAHELFDPTLTVVDSASAMAAASVRALGAVWAGGEQARPGALEAFVTDATRLSELAPRFLGRELDFELVDL